uniref:Uncharacterized protein n=1 Tax=Aegilops tauschii subsp. strangulata TaxID=200361 RepID=A0A453HC13_AEGTS
EFHGGSRSTNPAAGFQPSCSASRPGLQLLPATTIWGSSHRCRRACSSQWRRLRWRLRLLPSQLRILACNSKLNDLLHLYCDGWFFIVAQ